jgi:gliding motility-associated-like protein
VENACGITEDEINITKGICQLQMPNAFSPNYDGRNDLFRIKHWQFIKTFEMQIYDRWGMLVFRTTDPRNGWNGNYRGSPQPTGNYVWTISLVDLDGKAGFYRGNFLLLR